MIKFCPVIILLLFLEAMCYCTCVIATSDFNVGLVTIKSHTENSTLAMQYLLHHKIVLNTNAKRLQKPCIFVCNYNCVLILLFHMIIIVRLQCKQCTWKKSAARPNCIRFRIHLYEILSPDLGETVHKSIDFPNIFNLSNDIEV